MFLIQILINAFLLVPPLKLLLPENTLRFFALLKAFAST